MRQKVLEASIHETEGLLERNIAFGKGDAIIFVLSLLAKSTIYGPTHILCMGLLAKSAVYGPTHIQVSDITQEYV